MIWHLLPLAQWRSDPDPRYVPGTAQPAPFVHASPDEATMLAVANAFYRGAGEPLVVAALDESRIAAAVKWEPADPAPPPGVPAGTLFPHIYGPVDRAAVTGLRYPRADVTGQFVALEERPPTAETLDLLPHPEGGWFRQTWAAGPRLHPPGYPGDRPSATAIYFLLPPGARSAWHAVRSAELWLYHSGSPLPLLLGGSAATGPSADPEVVTLGPDLAANQQPQLVIPAGHWQSAGPAGPGETLVSCIVSPGFDFADFTSAGSATARDEPVL
jgi:predicted cupin superfamily sugar epimerase/uncharacterized protein (DUF952 family)